MYDFEIKRIIWENANFYFYETHEETMVAVDNAEGRTVIFYNGNLGIHGGDLHFEEALIERSHKISAHMAYLLLEEIWISLAKDGLAQGKKVYEFAEEIKTYADNFSDDEDRVVSAVIRHTKIECLNIWKESDNTINFDYPIREDKLCKLVDELNAWAKSRNSKIKFEAYCYDCSGACTSGFTASW